MSAFRTPPSPALPLEILYTVVESVDGLWAVERTLSNCALTCHALLSCSRKALYRNIAVRLGSPQGFVQAELLSRTLSADPTLGALIQSLVISHTTASGLRLPGNDDTLERPLLSSTLLPFGHMSQLRTLVLSHLQFQQADDFLDLIVSLPRLKRLACDAIAILDATEWPRLRSPDTRFPALSALRVHDWSGPYHTFTPLLFLRDTEDVGGVVQALDLDCGSAVVGLAWAGTIRATNARLNSLKISMADVDLEPHPAQLAILLDQFGGSLHSYVLESISSCAYLRTLSLKHIPRTRVREKDEIHDGTFLNVLCGVLERRPPPFPALERLHLRMLEVEGEMVGASDDVCARLASSLLDKAARPHFAHFGILVPVGVWSEDEGTWDIQYIQPILYTLNGSRVDPEAVRGRWRAAFSALQRAPDVELDITLFDCTDPAVQRACTPWSSSWYMHY
ncbi:hypothetical protein OH77DRAFT_1430565 [Trametes cingulata]|nr:hypothetical protein OH77DRAFT_1430565 [Trametes cingulata]